MLDNNRTKLDDKSLISVLLGVREESKACRLYDPISKRIIINRVVIFEEEKLWSWDKQIDVVVLHDLKLGEDCIVEPAR